MFSPSSRARLTIRDIDRFPGDTLFDRLARAVCHAGCLPRKELYEAWEVARRVRRRFRGGRIVDLGGGHGLLAHLMLLIDDSSPEAVVVDKVLPPSAATVHKAIAEAWPRLSGRIRGVTACLDEFELGPGDVVVSSHACGALTDRVLERAVAAGARVAVLPCCHDLARSSARAIQGIHRIPRIPRAEGLQGLPDDPGALLAWVDGALAIDIGRVLRLQRQGYRVWTHAIPAEITPKNRLLLGAPSP